MLLLKLLLVPGLVALVTLAVRRWGLVFRTAPNRS